MILFHKHIPNARKFPSSGSSGNVGIGRGEEKEEEVERGKGGGGQGRLAPGNLRGVRDSESV